MRTKRALAVVIGALAVAGALYALAAMIAGASLRATTCSEFSLTAEVAACRAPAIWAVVGASLLVGAAAAFIVAWRGRA